MEVVMGVGWVQMGRRMKRESWRERRILHPKDEEKKKKHSACVWLMGESLRMRA